MTKPFQVVVHKYAGAKGFMQHLFNLDLADKDTVFTTSVIPSMVCDKRVLGKLPHHLSCRCKEYWEPQFRREPANLKGTTPSYWRTIWLGLKKYEVAEVVDIELSQQLREQRDRDIPHDAWEEVVARNKPISIAFCIIGVLGMLLAVYYGK